MTYTEAMSQLTERQRTLIELREAHSMTFKAIGEKVGLSTGYATLQYKAAVKRVEELQATAPQTPPQAVSEPAEAYVAADGSVLTQPEAGLKLAADLYEIAMKGQRKPTVAIATATSQPKVAWVTGVPMAVPRSKTPWTSVTIRA